MGRNNGMEGGWDGGERVMGGTKGASGVAKAGPRAWPKHHVRPAHVTQSRVKRARVLMLLDSLELAYSRCPANTNDLATPLKGAMKEGAVGRKGGAGQKGE